MHLGKTSVLGVSMDTRIAAYLNTAANMRHCCFGRRHTVLEAFFVQQQIEYLAEQLRERNLNLLRPATSIGVPTHAWTSAAARLAELPNSLTHSLDLIEEEDMMLFRTDADPGVALGASAHDAWSA